MTSIFGLERPVLISLVAFMVFGLVENAVGTISGPSFIYYLNSVGGNNDDFGRITSIRCLAAAVMNLYFSNWIDSNGNKYQAPLACSFILGILGSLIYFLASIMPTGFWGVNAILVGKVIKSMGGGGKMLLRSWVATTIPIEKQKPVFSCIAMIQIGGTAIGPLLNTLVAEIDSSIPITSTFSIPLNPYNSVGLVSIASETIIWILVALFVIDPPPLKQKSLSSVASTESSTASEPGLFESMAQFDICFPLIRRFVMVTNGTLVLTGVPIIALQMLNWTPIEISVLSVVTSGASFVGLGLTLYLSLKDTSDFAMLMIGNVTFAVVGVLAFLLWRDDVATAATFAFPLLLTSIFMPLTSPANMSSFNSAVLSKPELAGYIGRLNSVYMQFALIPGIVFPPFVTSYIVRKPEDINLDNPHELSQWVLLVPVLALLVVLGLLYEEYVLGNNELETIKASEDEASLPGETTKLVTDKKSKSSRRSIVEINQVFTRKYEVERRMSVEIEDNVLESVIENPFETATQSELMKKLSADKEEWERLLTLDEEVNEEEIQM